MAESIAPSSVFLLHSGDCAGGLRLVVVQPVAAVTRSWRPPPSGTPAPEPTPTPSLRGASLVGLAGTTLSTSDAVVRELAAALSSNPKLVAWLANDDLIRRFTPSVDNIAAGISPKAHFAFLRPKEGFEVDKKGGGFSSSKNRVTSATIFRRWYLPRSIPKALWPFTANSNP